MKVGDGLIYLSEGTFSNFAKRDDALLEADYSRVLSSQSKQNFELALIFDYEIHTDIFFTKSYHKFVFSFSGFRFEDAQI